MTSDRAPQEAYVWVWLPGQCQPVVAGRLGCVGPQLLFNYGRSYLQRSEAIPLYLPELPLQSGILPLRHGLNMPGCLRDAGPDAWGRRVLIHRRTALSGTAADTVELDELSCLLETGSDRIGALDFQASPTHYLPRQTPGSALTDLLQAADSIEQGVPLATPLAEALQHGSSLGGARPKVLLDDKDGKWIAKFSSSQDARNVVKAEYIAMRLAAKVGLDVAPVRLARSLGKDVLLIERFDRVRAPQGWQRRAMVSALTILELDEMLARYASYETLASSIRHRFTAPRQTLRELFGRLCFNILCGNTDDHARNHAAFWDGTALTLTPAYDICPQPRVGNEASQAMLIHGTQRSSQLSTCLDAAPLFLLDTDEARSLIDHQLRVIRNEWNVVCDEAALPHVERQALWRRQFLNPYALQGVAEAMGDI